MEIPPALPFLLDGATGTNLIRQWSSDLCVPEYIRRHPKELTALQKAYQQAGCQAVYAPTFGASRPALAPFGLEDQVETLNRELVELTKQAVPGLPVGASISPSGLTLHPYGDAAFSELRTAVSQQAKAAKAAGADFFAVETMTSLAEARAAVLSCRKLGLPILVTLAVDEEGKTPSGASAVSCLVTLQELGIAGFGLNCGSGIQAYPELIRELRPFAKVPLIAKPSAGLPGSDGSYAMSPKVFTEGFVPILQAGAQIAGGCCGTGPEHLASLRELVDQFDFGSVQGPRDHHDLLLANGVQTFLMDDDNVEFTEPLRCSVDMADELLALEEDSRDVILVEVHTPDDALQFAINAHFTRLPVCFYSEDELSLKTALLLYQGRALVDSQSPIDRPVLERIAQKYGAVVF